MGMVFSLGRADGVHTLIATQGVATIPTAIFSPHFTAEKATSIVLMFLILITGDPELLYSNSILPGWAMVHHSCVSPTAPLARIRYRAACLVFCFLASSRHTLHYIYQFYWEECSPVVVCSFLFAMNCQFNFLQRSLYFVFFFECWTVNVFQAYGLEFLLIE